PAPVRHILLARPNSSRKRRKSVLSFLQSSPFDPCLTTALSPAAPLRPQTRNPGVMWQETPGLPSLSLYFLASFSSALRRLAFLISIPAPPLARIMRSRL